MKRLVFAIALTLSATACGGGGSGSGPVPGASASNSAQQSSATLPASSGTIASGYIECDNAADVAAGQNCNNGANFANGAYAFTAVAATANGTPIAQQLSGGAAMAFANGSYRVVEAASDGPPIVSIAGGPWSTPGSIFASGAAAYGNRFFVQCVRVGVANLQLVSNGSGTLPFASSAFASNVPTVNCVAGGAISIE